jgi:hypothetical protein
VKIGLPLLIIALIGSGLIFWFWPSSPPGPGPVVEKPRQLVEKVKLWLGSHPELLQCANISTVDVQGKIVSLGGRVSSEAQGAEIRQGVQSLERGLQVNDAFDIIPRPFCEVLDLLDPFHKRNEEQAFGLTASLNKQGALPVYYHNENFVLEVKTPTTFGSFVYVDYYSSDATVGHLFPNPQEPVNRFGPNRSFIVGNPSGPQPWSILPPFGRDLVTVIASKIPLFSTPRYAPESAETYLRVLHQALPKDVSNADVAATFYFITTRDQPSR